MEKEKEKNGPLYFTLFFSAKDEENFLLLHLERGVCRRPLVMRMPKKRKKKNPPPHIFVLLCCIVGNGFE